MASCFSASIRAQTHSNEKYQKECIPKLVAHGPFPKESFKYGANESCKRTPIVKYQINEDGTVTNVKLVRSAGALSIDNLVTEYTAKSKYQPGPAGCGITESEASIIIDRR